jgi:UMP-CMP kinase
MRSLSLFIFVLLHTLTHGLFLSSYVPVKIRGSLVRTPAAHKSLGTYVASIKMTSTSPLTAKKDYVVNNNKPATNVHTFVKDYAKPKKPAVMFVLGGPGAGKGTQCLKLSETYGMTHLSAGDLLREERASGSDDGKLIDKIIAEGNIVPVEITLNLLRNAIVSNRGNRFLIDGFPRNFDNLNGWMDSNMKEVCDVEGCIFISCPEVELEKRLLDRGKTSGRSDDNAATARKRFATYKESTMPIVDYYKEQGMLLEVSGDQSVEEVYADLDKLLLPYIAEEVVYLTQQQIYGMTTNDWKLYKHSCDPGMSSFESGYLSTSGNGGIEGEEELESNGKAVRGVDAHKRYFDANCGQSLDYKEGVQKNRIIGKPMVRILGKVAVVSYTRELTRIRSSENESVEDLLQQTKSEIVNMDNSNCEETLRFHETKIWSQIDNHWKMVHVHLDSKPYKF